ncbi:hypothetical protein [Candidatus Mycolicibacterium alkanivorans]|uniref:Alanine and proline rich membrane protein n=1 Tax=Candidatus Mycolicibacterium alkanivorans TaxID=2954114 RepID=A0ABS9YRI1_9MYCO|nr:hypothetical protein [Candidatus Mycolicibacterium alkanivorans]MCI4673778.1 hypothetical protein [Candidatus Mycolicibacterium alkanivorans]
MSQAPYGPGPTAPAPWPPQGPPASRGPSRLPTVIAIVIALIAVAVAIGAWFRPAPKAETPAAKTYSEQEVADAKKAVCDAYQTVQSTLQASANQSAPGPNDTLQQFALSVNGRLAAFAGGDYLYRELTENPAVPKQLSEAVRQLASAYQKAALAQIAQADRSKLDSIYKSADAAAATATEVCR